MIIVCRPRVQWKHPLLPLLVRKSGTRAVDTGKRGRDLINCTHYQPTISYFSQTRSFAPIHPLFPYRPSLFLLSSRSSLSLFLCHFWASFSSFPASSFYERLVCTRVLSSHSCTDTLMFHRVFQLSINKCACYLHTAETHVKRISTCSTLIRINIGARGHCWCTVGNHEPSLFIRLTCHGQRRNIQR